jgi:pyruvate/2-oxoglutarate dehydrogenase complex dihydrolipoamide acyltransferase (E2) component
MVYRDYVDLSVAVATPKGLVTPVIRNAESLSFVEFEQELTALGKKACLAHCAFYEKLSIFFSMNRREITN